jgi:hopanoid biosynthesis associated RND transporter like protein HpnN
MPPESGHAPSTVPGSRSGVLLRRLVGISCRHPRLTLAVAGLTALLSVLYALASLGLETSTRALLPQDRPYIDRYVQYDREFGELDDLVIAVEAPAATATAYADRLVAELAARRVPLRQVIHRIDRDHFEGFGLLYLSRDRLAGVRDELFEHQELLEDFTARPTLDTLVQGVADQVGAGFALGFLDLGLGPRAGAGDLGFVEALLAAIGGHLDGAAPAVAPWRTLFALEDDGEGRDGYLFSEDDRLLFILAEPDSEAGTFTGDRAAIQQVRATMAALRSEFPDVRAGVTGKAAIANDEMVAAFRDAQLATLLAAALTLGLLFVAFRRVAEPLLMLGALLLSLAWSLGVTTLVVGHLSLFSVIFVAIIIGIGIDYGIYLLYRCDEEHARGRSTREALEVAGERLGPATLVGALTSSAVFYALMLTDFRGLQELGFIAGSAIVLAWLAMMTVFPATLVLRDRRRPRPPVRPPPAGEALARQRVPLLERWAARPRRVLAVAGLLSGLALWGLREAEFDYNLLNLQARGAESVTWERKILDGAGRSGFVALSSAESVEALREAHATFRGLPSVSAVDSVLRLLPDDQDEKLTMIGQLTSVVQPLALGAPRLLDAVRLLQALDTLRRRLGILATEATDAETRARLGAAARQAEAVTTAARRAGPAESARRLAPLQRELYDEFERSFGRLRANLATRPVTLADLPPALRSRFVSEQGRFLLKIHPAVDIWDRVGAERFVADLRSVDPGVTGTLVITHEAIRAMERSYRDGTLYAIGLLTVITALMLRGLRLTVLALLPVGLGMLWAVGLMDLVGLKFTMANVFAVPLLLGAASEFGLHVVLRHEEDRPHAGPLVARSMVLAVLLNGLTHVAGFGSLLVASHQGIFGLGLLLTLGSIMIMLATLMVLPALLRIAR